MKKGSPVTVGLIFYLAARQCSLLLDRQQSISPTRDVAVELVGTGEPRNLIQGGTQPRYASSGHLVYAQGGSLMAVPFDPRRLTAAGTAIPVVEGVLQSPASGAAQYSISATGTLVYISGGVQSAQSKLVWVSRNGVEQPLAAPMRAYQFPQLSRDGRRLAVGITEQEGQIWLFDLARETLTRFTFEGNSNSNPIWTPDGKRIAFQSNKEGAPNLFWQLADGSGGLERLSASELNQVPTTWSPDGQHLAFFEVDPTSQRDIWVLRLGDHKAQPFLKTPFDESVPRFSPDGRWLAYISNESGRFEIYVQPYPGPGGKWQISTEGGTEPVWNSERTGAVLPRRRQDDGGGDYHTAEFRCGYAPDAICGTVPADPGNDPQLRRVPRWPALPDAQAQRVDRGGADANQRRAELV